MSSNSQVTKIRVKGVNYDLVHQVESIDSSTLLSMNDDSSLMKVYVDANEDNVYVASHSDNIKIAGKFKTLTEKIEDIDSNILDISPIVNDFVIDDNWEPKVLKTSNLNIGDVVTDSDFVENANGIHLIVDITKYNTKKTEIDSIIATCKGSSSYRTLVELDEDYKIIVISSILPWTDKKVDIEENCKYVVFNNFPSYQSSNVVKIKLRFTDEKKTLIRSNIGFGDGTFDSAPTENSQNLITSGALYNTLQRYSLVGKTNEIIESIGEREVNVNIVSESGKAWQNINGVATEAEKPSYSISSVEILRVTDYILHCYCGNSANSNIFLVDENYNILNTYGVNDNSWQDITIPSVDIANAAYLLISVLTNKVAYVTLKYTEMNNISNAINEIAGIKTNISMLFIGNSLNADVVAYLPLLLGEHSNINFTICSWYIGGVGMQEHLRVMQAGERCEICSVWKSGENKWTPLTESAKTIQSILSNYDFDVVCLQDLFRANLAWDITYIKGVIDFIKTNYTRNPLDFVTLFHAPIRSGFNDNYNFEIECYRQLLKETEIKAVIPAGIAIKKAFENDILKNIGERSDFSYDGIHAQEGIQCMIQTYVLAQFVFEKYGLPYGIQGSRVRVTDITGLNIPNSHGTPIGMDNEQYCREAQTVAAITYKETALFEDNYTTDTIEADNDNPVSSKAVNAAFAAVHAEIEKNMDGIPTFVIGSYDGTPIVGSTATVYIESPKLPDGLTPLLKGGKVTINITDGWKTAITGYSLRVNGKRLDGSTGATIVKSQILEFDVEETIETIKINTTSAYVKDDTVPLAIEVSYQYSGLSQQVADVRLEVDDKVGLFDSTLIDNYKDEENDAWTESFVIDYDLKDKETIPYVVTLNAKYDYADSNVSRDLIPTIKVGLVNNSGSAFYASQPYKIGSDIEYRRRSWRVPAVVDDYNKLHIDVTIPEGILLDIQSFEIKSLPIGRHFDYGIQFSAHHGFGGPTDSIPAFQCAGELGFTRCTTTPKITSDGVGICFHDDSTISGELVWNDGTSITGDYNRSIETYTYSEVLSFRRKNLTFGVQRVATLDDFFRICAFYGMSPEFGVHTYSTELYNVIKNLGKKYNILDKVWIKTGNVNALSTAASVFAPNEIAGFMINRATTEPATTDPISILKNAGLIDQSATTVEGCAYKLIYQPFSQAVTDSIITTAKNEGYIVGLVEGTPKLSGEEINDFINKGVTYFCMSTSHCSLGLYW